MLDPFWNFITANAGNIVISISVGFLFFVLGPLGLWFSKRKIRKEKIKKHLNLNCIGTQFSQTVVGNEKTFENQ